MRKTDIFQWVITIFRVYGKSVYIVVVLSMSKIILPDTLLVGFVPVSLDQQMGENETSVSTKNTEILILSRLVRQVSPFSSAFLFLCISPIDFNLT